MGTPALRIRLLGELSLHHGVTTLPPIESARATSLLAYLLLHRAAPQPRQHLAFLLWPDSTEAQARTNLRHVLHNLRRALPDFDQFIAVTPRTLQWRPDSPFWLDVAAFEAALATAGEGGDNAELEALREAVALYTGDLLEGLYDEWLLPERERLRRRYLEALERLTGLLEAQGKYSKAVLYAEQLLQHDPLHEETYRLLMRLHDARGDRPRALRVYHVCVAALQRELGIEPSPATQAAYEALLTAGREPQAGESPAGGPGDPRLVARVDERARLQSLWRVAAKGGAQLVLVTGEPGIGKTRLVEDFRDWCIHRGAKSALARAYAAEGGLAYAPVVEWLRSDALRAQRERLDRSRLTELARLVPEVLAEIPGLTQPDPLPEREQRQRLFDAAAQAVRAAGGPLLLVADDLQWWDPESLQFLHYLLRVEPEARLLVAATARREEIDPQHPLNELCAGLQALGCFVEIELSRLSPEETAALAQQVTRHALEAQAASELHRETEGNPLFVVEALRAGWPRGPARQPWTSPKVQAVIESRLAQLSEPARELVGVAATIGRAFTAEALAAASEVGDNTLVRSLDELWWRQLIREQGVEAYDFSHDKIREVAYRGLSPARRRHYHLKVARALERLHAPAHAAVSGQIADHYERGGAASQASIWYERAAEAAQQVYAYGEALRLLQRALELVRTLPAGPERDARELELLTAFPGPVMAVEGFAASRLEDVRQRALQLAQSLGVELAPPLLRSLALASLSRDDFPAAREAGLQLRARGERSADDRLLVEAAYVLGIAAFWSGELEAARMHFETAVERYRPEHRRDHILRYGQDTKVICLSRLGNTLWFLGRPEAAIRACEAARVMADEIGHPYSRSTAVTFGALLAVEMRDLEYLRQCVATLTAGHSEAARQTQAITEALAGYLDAIDSQKQTGVARIERVLADAQQIQPAPGLRACLMRLLLEAHRATGEAQAGLAAAEHALAMAGVHLWEAEVRRLQGEFLEALGAPATEVEAALASARDVARRQGAIMLELRTGVSLLRHHLARGDQAAATAARDQLRAVIEAMPEGRDTPEVREAVTLLALP